MQIYSHICHGLHSGQIQVKTRLPHVYTVVQILPLQEAKHQQM